MERRLRAIAAIFGTTAGLDGQQGGKLHLVRVEMFAVNLLRAVQQIGERQLEQGLHVCHAPALRSIGCNGTFYGLVKFDGLAVHV